MTTTTTAATTTTTLPSSSTSAATMATTVTNAETTAATTTKTQSSSSSSPPPKSFYKRVLPTSCTAFSSKTGRDIFASALHCGGLKSFFALVEQHTTQSEPAYCGISTLVVALNAFAVDPKQSWKGPWRWYQEEMLNCCLDMEQVKETGITLPDFACLAICQGLSVNVRYAEEPDGGSVDDFREFVKRACVDAEEDDNDNDDNNNNNNNNGDQTIKDILIVSYNRKTLGQTGTGHFSPIAAYDEASDSVLILDTARFKYGAHWAPLPLVHEAMLPHDSSTGRSRGFVLLSLREDDDDDKDNSDHRKEDQHEYHHHDSSLPVSILFRYKFTKEARQIQADFYNLLLSSSSSSSKSSSSSGSNGSLSWEQVHQYWTRNGADPSYIWQAIEPQFKTHDQDTMNLVQQVTDLIQTLLPPPSSSGGANHAAAARDNNDTKNKDKGDKKKCQTTTGKCRPNQSRTVSLWPTDVIYIVYLSTLGEQERRDLVYGSTAGAGDCEEEQATTTSDVAAKEQLLAAAHLIEMVLAVSATSPLPSPKNPLSP